MYGHRSTRVAAFGGLSVHTNLEATAIIVSTGFFLGSSVLERVLVVASFAFATGLHLLAHLGVAKAFGKGIDRMVLTRAGRIDYSGGPPTFIENVLRTAAGATTNAVCALVGYLVLESADTQQWHPTVLLVVSTFTTCSFILTIINFLPAVPLDGGLILRSILERVIGTKAQKAAVIVSTVVMAAMAVAGVWWFQPVLVYLAIVITYDNWRAQLRPAEQLAA